jgi:hypothetical protein
LALFLSDDAAQSNVQMNMPVSTHGRPAVRVAMKRGRRPRPLMWVAAASVGLGQEVQRHALRRAGRQPRLDTVPPEEDPPTIPWEDEAPVPRPHQGADGAQRKVVSQHAQYESQQHAQVGIMSSTRRSPDAPVIRVGHPVVISGVGGGIVAFQSRTNPAASEHFEHLAARNPCCVYKPGHAVHQIQVRLGLATWSTPWCVRDADDHVVTVRSGLGDVEQWWLHDTETIRAALLLDDHPIIRLHDHGLARISNVLLYPCRDPHHEHWAHGAAATGCGPCR